MVAELKPEPLSLKDAAAIAFSFVVVTGWLAVIGLAVFAGARMLIEYLR